MLQINDTLKQKILDAADHHHELTLQPEDVMALAVALRPRQGQGKTLGEMLDAGAFGIWADRDDITDGAKFAQDLRRKAERRE